MNWNKLKSYLCPNCNSALEERGGIHVCSMNCGFVISKEKFDKIIVEKYKSYESPAIDNQEALNNMDRPLVSEDFNDSPFL